MHYVKQLKVVGGSPRVILTPYKRQQLIKDKSNKLRYSSRSKKDEDNLKAVDNRLQRIIREEQYLKEKSLNNNK